LSTIPNTYINPRARHIGVSKLRLMNASNLRKLDETLVIQENDQPLAVLVNYEEFLRTQKQLIAALETRTLLSDKDELSAVLAGLMDARTGKSKALEDVRRSPGKTKDKG
jgi:hypothetical protein